MSDNLVVGHEELITLINIPLSILGKVRISRSFLPKLTR